jgi:hypothetical protein
MLLEAQSSVLWLDSIKLLDLRESLQEYRI